MDASVYLGIVLFLVIFLGVTGNGLSMLVWSRGRRCRKLPSAIFLRALAVSDTFALCIPALNEAVGLVSGVGPNHQNRFICKLEVTGRHFCLIASSWIIVSFTMERALSVIRPFKQTCWKNRCNSIILIIIFVVSFLMNLPFGLVSDMIQVMSIHSASQSIAICEHTATSQQILADMRGIQNVSGNFGLGRDSINISLTANDTRVKFQTTDSQDFIGVVCSAKSVDEEKVSDNVTRRNNGSMFECSSDPSSFFSFYNWYHIWLMDFVLIFVLPFTLITTGNVIVVCFLVFRRRRVTSVQDSIRTQAVTKRAIAVSIMHCITTGPFSLFVLVPGWAETAYGIKYSTEFFILTGVMVFAYSNHAINFILYSVFGTDFRRDFIEMFLVRQPTFKTDSIPGAEKLKVLVTQTEDCSLDMKTGTMTSRS